MNPSMHKAYTAWRLGEALRRRRLRFKRYTFGDQWGDTVTDSSGFPVSERLQQAAGGHSPATNNIIRQLVKTVVGCYRAARKERGSGLELLETDARTFEEFLISGCALQRVSLQRRPDGTAGIDPVSPARFFIGSHSDLYGRDVEVIGQLHDFTPGQTVMRHSHGDRRRAAEIKRIYESAYMQNCTRRERMLGESFNDSIDFYHADAGMCRVIELWTLEPEERLRCHDEATGSFYHASTADLARIEREKERRSREGGGRLLTRWEIVPRWHCRFFAPTGEVIDSYTAQSHPYAFRFYPLIDGEIHSFVEDVIEQQRNINRLLTLNDRLLATAAKGVLLFPDNQVSREMPLEEVAANWASPDSLVLFRAMPGQPGPHQVISSPGNLGVSAMVDQQMKLISEVSGVSAAMRGLSEQGNTSASLYDSQYRNSMAALSDIFDSFDSFIASRDRLLAAFALT